MDSKSNKKRWVTIGGWIVSIVVAIIGTYGAVASSQSQFQSQEQNQSIVLNINGEEVKIDQDNAQDVYNELEEKINTADTMLTELQTKIDSLEQTNDVLESENEKYKGYGMDALVSINKNYDTDKVSLLAFAPVNSNDWNPNEGTLKDSLDNDYFVTLPYVIINAGSYGEYYTNGMYKTLEFKLVPHETMDQSNVSQIKIYADDLLVFTSKNIHRKTENETYSVNIGNAKFIKITCEQIEGRYNSSVMLLDSTLIK